MTLALSLATKQKYYQSSIGSHTQVEGGSCESSQFMKLPIKWNYQLNALHFLIWEILYHKNWLISQMHVRQKTYHYDKLKIESCTVLSDDGTWISFL